MFVLAVVASDLARDTICRWTLRSISELLNQCQMAKTIENPHLFKLDYLLEYLII